MSKSLKLIGSFSFFVVVPRKDQIIISGLQEVVESGTVSKSKSVLFFQRKSSTI